jgi:hypothetical protein
MKCCVYEKLKIYITLLESIAIIAGAIYATRAVITDPIIIAASQREIHPSI